MVLWGVIRKLSFHPLQQIIGRRLLSALFVGEMALFFFILGFCSLLNVVRLKGRHSSVRNGITICVIVTHRVLLFLRNDTEVCVSVSLIVILFL